SAQIVPSSVTSLIAPPPSMSGAASPSAPTGPTRAPAPNGAYSLWPEKARKSMPSGAMSIGRRGASRPASTHKRAAWTVWGGEGWRRWAGGRGGGGGCDRREPPQRQDLARDVGRARERDDVE